MGLGVSTREMSSPRSPVLIKAGGEACSQQGQKEAFRKRRKAWEKKIKAIKIFRERNKARHSEK